MTDEICLVICSGGLPGIREYVEVGVVVVLWVRQYILSFYVYSNRSMSLNLRVKGGQLYAV